MFRSVYFICAILALQTPVLAEDDEITGKACGEEHLFKRLSRRAFPREEVVVGARERPQFDIPVSRPVAESETRVRREQDLEPANPRLRRRPEPRSAQRVVTRPEPTVREQPSLTPPRRQRTRGPLPEDPLLRGVLQEPSTEPATVVSVPERVTDPEAPPVIARSTYVRPSEGRVMEVERHAAHGIRIPRAAPESPLVLPDGVYNYVFDRSGEGIAIPSLIDTHVSSASHITHHDGLNAALAQSLGIPPDSDGRYSTDVVAAGEFIVRGGHVRYVTNVAGAFHGQKPHLDYATARITQTVRSISPPKTRDVSAVVRNSTGFSEDRHLRIEVIDQIYRDIYFPPSEQELTRRASLLKVPHPTRETSFWNMSSYRRHILEPIPRETYERVVSGLQVAFERGLTPSHLTKYVVNAALRDELGISAQAAGDATVLFMQMRNEGDDIVHWIQEFRFKQGEQRLRAAIEALERAARSLPPQ